ncbi:phosphogluconate dehydrogenase (NAD(+)-dependent, decarboxylating) [Stenotrophomonas sp. SY1]|uniref:phosphogluconate dehydrogenase (NAD(+)-dependent, decarboxylating) n=1 Tax=Stenotrophomonas sp. SY1 TaxID=477235 RepID=UPI001E5F10EE|nr:decarboxylating 6-phosphogluconate dehydrogenase [Stenotrophomonas sp. SY1]MCD9088205.1 decarboxylating 6-phosphogluconate dehydrogenase [Stenotrophomonas sp. SY1]
MELGMIGLGRMGANMAQRLHQAGITVTGFDPGEAARAQVSETGIATVETLQALVQALPTPRVLWLMVPSKVVDATLEALLPLLAAQDVVIDGGNSWYRDSQRRAVLCGTHQVDFVDCGTSGGIWGLREGYCLMLGGDAAQVQRLSPLFQALAPAADRGWAHVGPVGAGHFSKMVHNGIEYGMMQAYAEGFALMQKKAEFDLDLAQLAEVWRHGSVVRSWLLDLSADVLAQNASLEGIAPYVEDSGEGRWTVSEAIELDVPAPIITLSLLERLRSRETNSFTDRLLAAMRNEFGGHAIKSTGVQPGK